MKTIIATIALIAPSFCTATAQQTPDEQLGKRIDSLYQKYNANPGPGLAITVVRDGQVIVRRGYGLADIEHKVPITSSTVFDVASVSKQFTGLAVAMLVTEGKVKLSDDIRKYIPELHKFEKPITIDNLLHHTSGIRDWPGTLSVGGWSYDDVISFDQILNMAYHQQALNFVPGAEHLYSNTGYNLLAEMVQRVTGKSFSAHLDDVIFKPLGMSHSHFMDDHTSIVDNRAYGYARVADGSFRHTPNALTALGSSSLYSSADDLAKWLMNFDDARVGGAAMALSRTRGRLNNGDSIPYAFGISHGNYRGLANLNHSGSWAQFSTYVAWFPQQKTGIVVLANSSSISATEAANRVASIVLEANLLPNAAPASNNPVASAEVPSNVLAEYAGLYRLGPGWYTQIRSDGKRLTSQATNEGVAPMVARSQQEFFVPNYNAAMTFRRDAAGKVTYLEYRGQRAPKVDESKIGTRMPALKSLAGTYESAELGTSWVVSVRDNVLSIYHPRYGELPLHHVIGDEFGADVWFMRSVAFTRDASGRVTGLVVNGDLRSRDIRFDRRQGA